MPELAEVEFFRRKWNAGIGDVVARIHVNAGKRIFRDTETARLQATLVGSRLLESFAHGKQMMFRFSRGGWLGIHLGMTGELRVEPPRYSPGKHDHLALFQPKRVLVFNDARQFGRVRFDQGKAAPDWWFHLPPEILSRGFTPARMADQLARHRSLPLKPALLDQETFPGIGNWMADEILWQARLRPRTKSGELSPGDLRGLWRTTRSVSKRALSTVAKESGEAQFGDPPKNFLFHVRWRRGAKCPRDGSPLRYDTIGGRTTVWCTECQR
jgi:formamidopyrimidine-DNA glycosylase